MPLSADIKAAGYMDSLLRSGNPERNHQQLESRDEIPIKEGRVCHSPNFDPSKIFLKPKTIALFSIPLGFSSEINHFQTMARYENIFIWIFLGFEYMT